MVVFSIYGTWASEAISLAITAKIPVAQIGGSVLVGLSGSQILTGLAQKKADEITRNNLAAIAAKAVDKEE